MNYQQFYKSATPKWVSNVSGWVDRNIRQPAQKFVDKNIAQPVQKGFVQPVQKVVDNSREVVINSFSPVKEHANYVMKTIPNYMANEVGKGYQEYYQPYSIDHLNPLRAAGLVMGGVADRYSHDYSTNQDGTPNTDKPTWGTFALDVGRNMARNAMFDSDWKGVSQLPVVGEVKNSTLGNAGALPFNIYTWADMAKPVAKPIARKVIGAGTKGLSTAEKAVSSSKALAVPKSSYLSEEQLAKMTGVAKRRYWSKLEALQRDIYKKYDSSINLLNEYQASPESKLLNFNQWLNKALPERKIQFQKEMNALSDEMEKVYPWLKGFRESNGVINVPRAMTYTEGANKIPPHPDTLRLRNFQRIFPIINRAGLRTHRDNRWNTLSEQGYSLAEDLGGDVATALITSYGPDMLASAGGYIHPALGSALSKASPYLSWWGSRLATVANQSSALQNAFGRDDTYKIPDFKQWISGKLGKLTNGAIDFTNNTLDYVGSNLPALTDVQSQGVMIPGAYNNQVQ